MRTIIEEMSLREARERVPVGTIVLWGHGTTYRTLQGDNENPIITCVKSPGNVEAAIPQSIESLSSRSEDCFIQLFTESDTPAPCVPMVRRETGRMTLEQARRQLAPDVRFACQRRENPERFFSRLGNYCPVGTTLETADALNIEITKTWDNVIIAILFSEIESAEEKARTAAMTPLQRLAHEVKVAPVVNEIVDLEQVHRTTSSLDINKKVVLGPNSLITVALAIIDRNFRLQVLGVEKNMQYESLVIEAQEKLLAMKPVNTVNQKVASAIINDSKEQEDSF